MSTTTTVEPEKVESPIKRKYGRPPEYKEEYCEQLLQCCREGFTITAFCARIDVARESLYRWANAYPEFSDACQRARVAFQEHWERRFALAVGDRNQNSNAILTFLAATCADFRPNSVVEHKVQMQLTRALSTEELKALAAGAIDVSELDRTPENRVRSLPDSTQASDSQRDDQ